MSEAATLRAALTELLEKCKGESEERLRTATAVSPTRAADQLEYLEAAETALKRLADSADSDECAAVAREVLSAVARFRNCLQSPDR